MNDISTAIRMALTNDDLVDNAALVNIATAQSRLSGDAIGKDINQFYSLS